MYNHLFTDPQLVEQINKYSRKKIFARDEVLINPGEEIVFVPVVLKGCIRIIRQDAEGREVFLYHLFSGQTCALSLTCCQAGQKSMVKAVAEEDTEVLQIPVRLTEDLFVYPEWKAFVSTTYSLRFRELIDVIDLIAFSGMDKVLLNYLRKRANALHADTLQITHQQIADELHIHREAVSRLLRTMEQKKIVQLGRHSIRLLAVNGTNVPG